MQPQNKPKYVQKDPLTFCASKRSKHTPSLCIIYGKKKCLHDGLHSSILSLREMCPNTGKYGPEITPYLDIRSVLDYKTIHFSAIYRSLFPNFPNFKSSQRPTSHTDP